MLLQEIGTTLSVPALLQGEIRREPEENHAFIDAELNKLYQIAAERVPDLTPIQNVVRNITADGREKAMARRTLLECLPTNTTGSFGKGFTTTSTTRSSRQEDPHRREKVQPPGGANVPQRNMA